MRARCAAALLVLALVLATPSTLGHANPAESYPPRGERIDESPTDVWIRFTEPVEPQATRLQVLNATLTEHSLDTVRIDENGYRAQATLTAPLPPGGYILRWEVISTADGHKTYGAIPFGIGANATLLEGTEGAAGALRVDAVVGKTLAFLGLALAAGTFAFWYGVLPRGQRKGHEVPMERLGVVASWMHLVGIAVFAHSQWQISGLGAIDYFTATTFGQGLTARLAVAAALVVGFRYAARRDVIPRALWATLLGLVAVAFLLYGRFSHTAALIRPLAIGVAADALHLAAVGTWVGGLVAFVLFLRSLPDDKTDLAAHLRIVPKRFSDLATWSVAVAGLTGVFMLWAVAGFDIGSWIGTPYGILLALKVALALVMIVLGGVNRFVYVARYIRGGGMTTVRAFRDNVRREVVLGVVVFLLAGALTNLSPPFAPDTAHGGGDGVDIPTGLDGGDRLVLTNTTAHFEWNVQFHPPPALNEPTHILIGLFDPETQSRVNDATRVEIVFRNTDNPDLGEDRVRAQLSPDGTYDTYGSYFPVAGAWLLTFYVDHPNGAYRESFEATFRL